MINFRQILKVKTMLMVTIGSVSFAQNPLIRDQFTADPSARVFGDRVYVFPSHDILATEGKGRKDWFCMEDYHVFSSANLTDWTDHGMIVEQNKVPWVKPNSYSMWAPDCIERNGKYYFYFPSVPKDTINFKRGFTVGVAIANKPEGPYVPESEPIKGVRGIDPNVFIDKDGQAYLYWSGGNIFVAKLKENMVELDSEVKTLENLPEKGLKEGPYMFERNGIYYLTYPHVENKIERLEYATANNPLGPFKVAGVIMDESPTGCWTNHHSIIEFKKEWYLFYHHNDLSPQFDKARSIRADYLHFNPDGSIQKVIPTLRGVGITKATDQIQIDRYSELSKEVSISFLDNQNSFKGWKSTFNQAGGWIQYNAVDFGQKKLKSVVVKALSEKGGVLQIRTKGINQQIIAEVIIPKNSNWTEIKSPLLKTQSGVQNLFVTSKNDNQIEVDWIKFE
ncbi:family 43 glycosylhydrolase [Flavobacterium sp.]|uniref:family 43 glycosylhydrolase n=1 Tax=Flavobacterium sp. TaxID=239 RepID=UPI002C7EEDDF|nr:family 43 glycosylhydrolase [Flavobacterium sp.]HSD07516.1 family 43 glycosylhydrolase [Flavobacterium sp.]